MKFAYADPPYLGCCRLYDHHHPDGLCWDDIDTHKLLLGRLVNDYPDGWALICHTPSLRTLLPLCPPRRSTSGFSPYSTTNPATRLDDLYPGLGGMGVVLASQETAADDAVA